jgi:hypothetical protein
MPAPVYWRRMQRGTEQASIKGIDYTIFLGLFGVPLLLHAVATLLS